jgi:hypothetical protein
MEVAVTSVSACQRGYLFGAAAAILSWLALSTTAARAIDVQCLEDARYQRLYEIFGGDPAKFAAYLEVDTGTHRLPDPDACRAALVRGGIGERSDDRARLLQFITSNRGWLAAIYLESGGGNVNVGRQLGWAVRAFRLKTYVAPAEDEESFYQPDFGIPPPAISPQATAIVPSAPARCRLKNSTPVEKPSANMVSGIARLDSLTSTYEDNTDRAGHDFRNLTPASPNPKLCQQQCMQDRQCRAWTYVAAERSPSRQPVCWLKNDVPAATKGEYVVSGVVMRPETFQPDYEEATDRPGQDYRRFDLPSPNPRLCQQNCQQDRQCRAWSYERPADSALVTLMSGWGAYQAGEIPLAPMNGCASACTFLHVAGIDRHGVSNVHRARLDFTQMSANAAALLAEEPSIIAYYNYMDAGSDVVRAYQSTSTNDLTPVTMTRSPRYVTDYLIAKCHADPEKLESIERQIDESLRDLSPSGFDLKLPLSHLRAGLVSVHARRQSVERCVARDEEKDRLQAFDRLCGKGCDVGKLAADFDADLSKAIAAK